MSDAPPRLESTTGSQPGYAPISWAAAASLGVASFFVLILGILAISAVIRKQPLIEPWLLAFPLFAVLLAFTARRQIANSEGTRTGETYASAGWWIGLLGGLGYFAYLGAIEVAVRNDAQREFIAFAEVVKKIDPTKPQDPNIYDATLRTVAPGQRTQIRNPKNPAEVERVLKDELLRFRQLDMTRIVGRNRENVEFTNFGVQGWEQTPTRISCTLTCKMISPEGEHSLVVPMQAVVDRGLRQWQVIPSQSGYVKSESLTRYGWMVKQVEESGRLFSIQFLTILSLPEQAPAAYVGFVQPGSTEAAAAAILATGGGRATIAGAVALLPPVPPGYDDALGKLFTQPDDQAALPSELARFRDSWNNGRLTMAGHTLRDTPDVNPVVRLINDGVEMTFPIELRLAGEGAVGAAARGKLLVRAVDPALRKELTSAREQKSSPSPTPPTDLLSQAIPWRVVRISSDLRPIAPPPVGPPDQ